MNNNQTPADLLNEIFLTPSNELQADRFASDHAENATCNPAGCGGKCEAGVSSS